MPDQGLAWLLEENNPSVRYFALTTLLDQKPKSAEIRKARLAIMDTGAVPAILGQQNEDGSWGLPERFYRDKYRGAVWNLILLAEMGADPV
ncbi:MAG: nitrogen fixation protein NifH, partial [Syntrophomonadaceae bacterium]|nr:nitrogen fixation protein NifH [Syntrophomonadaceae bacterium]